MLIKSKIIMPIVLIISALILLFNALWIPAKAQLAQYLMHDAWQKTLATGKPVSPWSWADTTPRFQLNVPRLGIEQLVLSGSSGRNLAFGPVHIAMSGNLDNDRTMMVSGHRDTHFAFLKDLISDDVVTMTDANRKYINYAVLKSEVVHKDRMPEFLHDDSSLLLVTCYPFDAVLPNTDLRYLVKAVRM